MTTKVPASMLASIEESSYTPTLGFASGSVGVAYATQSGEYFVSGGICHVSGRVSLSNKGSSTGAAHIVLPLSMRATNSTNPLGRVNAVANVASIAGAVQGYVATGSDRLQLFTQGATGMVDVTNANLTNTSVLDFNVAYPV